MYTRYSQSQNSPIFRMIYKIDKNRYIIKAMDQPDHMTYFLWKFVWDKFFILQNFFLEICKIQQKTMENVCQPCLSENFAKNFQL